MEILDSDQIPDTDEYDNDPEHHHMCVIFDDLINSDRETLTKISNHFIEGRHSRLSTIMITQDYHATPRGIRQNCNHLIVYKPPNNTHTRLIERDNNLRRGLLSSLKRFESLHLNKDNGKVYKNLDEIIEN